MRASVPGGATRGARKADVRHLRRRDEAGLDAETIGKEAEQPLPLGLVEARVLHAPAIELQAATHCYHLRVTALALIITNAMGNCNFMGPAYCVCGHDWSGHTLTISAPR